jgi:hypothetical protein
LCCLPSGFRSGFRTSLTERRIRKLVGEVPPCRAVLLPEYTRALREPGRCYPYLVERAPYKKEFPAELARAGEARHFVSWLGAVAGLRGGALSDLAVAAEAVLTDVFLSEGGTLEIESQTSQEGLRVTIRHPELRRPRMAGLEGIMKQFLDGYELFPRRVVLVKRL